MYKPLQQFLIRHGFEEGHQILKDPPYNLEIKHDEVVGAYLYKYNQISSDMSEPICRDARGIVLSDKDPRFVLNIGFDKFFNYQEQHADKELSWRDAVIQEKIDGSIIKVSFRRDRRVVDITDTSDSLLISTNGSVDALKTDLPLPSENFKTFGELVYHLLLANNEGFDAMVRTAQQQEVSFIFELIGPHNRVVIPYERDELVFLGMRSTDPKDNFREWVSNDPHIDYLACYFRTPRTIIPDTNGDDLQQWLEQECAKLDWKDEGFVVYSQEESGVVHRVKMKGSAYLSIHRVRGEALPTPKRSFEMIKEGTIDDFLGHFPELSETPERIRNNFIRLSDYLHYVWVHEVVDKNRTSLPRKDYAAWVNAYEPDLYVEDMLGPSLLWYPSSGDLTTPDVSIVRPFLFFVYDWIEGKKKLKTDEDQNEMDGISIVRAWLLNHLSTDRLLKGMGEKV